MTILSERGAPTPVVWTKLHAPSSLMAAIADADIDTAAKASGLWPTYAEEVDRDSARERLAARTVVVPKDDAPAEQKVEVRLPRQPKGAKRDDNVVTGYLKSREGRAMANTVVRGIFGMLKKNR